MKTKLKVIEITGCGNGASVRADEEVVHQSMYKEDYPYGGNSGEAFLKDYEADRFRFTD